MSLSVVIYIVLAVGVLCALIVAVRTLRERTHSGFFEESVKQEYTIPSNATELEAYNTLKTRLMDKVQAMLGVLELESTWVEHLHEKELMVLVTALQKRMVKNIAALAQLQGDKSGQWKLWKNKLISERYWQSLLLAEQSVNEEIEECMLEADELRPGWRSSLLDESIHIWRKQRQLQLQEQRRLDTIEAQKRDEEERVRAAKEHERRLHMEEKQRLRTAEKAAEALVRQEQQEQQRDAKKKREGPPSGSKKKKA